MERLSCSPVDGGPDGGGSDDISGASFRNGRDKVICRRAKQHFKCTLLFLLDL